MFKYKYKYLHLKYKYEVTESQSYQDKVQSKIVFVTTTLVATVCMFSLHYALASCARRSVL